MSYSIDPSAGDLVIGGFDRGIGQTPYSGITDMKSVNPISIPGEASVSFSTASVEKAPILTNVVASVVITGNDLLLPVNATLESFQWVTFSSVGTSGLSLGIPYMILWDGNDGFNTKYQLYAATAAFPPSGSAVTITGNSSVTFSTINPGLIKYFTKSRGFNWAIDANGRVWSDIKLTGFGAGPSTSSWSYVGNTVDTSSNGNGIVCYQTVHNGTGGTGTSAGVDEWIFIWRNSQIDYTKITDNGAATSPIITWNYGWKPSAGTTGNSNYLQTNPAVNNSHQAIMTPDGRINYCDANQIGNFYQNVPSPGSNYVGFNPTTLASYTFQNYNILPFNDTAQCLMFLGSQVIIGGKLNIAYPWDLINNTYSTPLIQLPETNLEAMIAIGNNGFIFAGNRGNIYITNGSQADLFAKVPDHISGAVEPLISWGGSATAGAPTGTVTFNKRRMYFGCQVSLQAGGNATGYGGIWCIDTDTKAMWNSNQMSYGSYNGYVSALIVSTAQSAGGNSYGPSIGYGLLAGWSDGVTPIYGIDACISTPYTGGQSYVISDAIPVGTALKPMTAYQVEFKVAFPLQATETVQLLMTSSMYDYINNNFVSCGTTTGSNGSYTELGGTNPQVLSGNFPISVEKQQWLLLKAILTSKSSSPSYNRLIELRVIGDTISSQVPGQPFSIQ